MALIKTADEIALLDEGGSRLARVLDIIESKVAQGISTKELDSIAEEAIRAGGDEPSFLGYTPDGAPSPYPNSLCVSVNDEVVHGIPTENKVLIDGDIVSIDLGLKHKGFHTDMARTIAVGKINKKTEELVNATSEALEAGIAEAKLGNNIGDISAAIERVARKRGFSIVEVLGGHGIGRQVHEDPFIPNFGKKGDGLKLEPGMVIAIEPIFNEGSSDVDISTVDDYTFATSDGSRSAHFEHTIAITQDGPKILTQ
ncbi:MAG TPA: type I methionyl aminopeptidase [Candidatus Yonathbacteria bacterium]|nr:type I methionyl aminopeptidase [Candidatus Yonathbacteria bacterium]